MPEQHEVIEGRIIKLLRAHTPGPDGVRVLERCLRIFRADIYFARKGLDQQWLPVLRNGFERYEVSNYGYVRMRSGGNQGDALRPPFSHQYPRVALYKLGNRRNKQHMVDELVFESFVLKQALHENQRDLTGKNRVINHKNGNKYDASVENLEWICQTQNLMHAYGTKLR